MTKQDFIKYQAQIDQKFSEIIRKMTIEQRKTEEIPWINKAVNYLLDKQY